jgi:hypothetical protein
MTQAQTNALRDGDRVKHNGAFGQDDRGTIAHGHIVWDKGGVTLFHQFNTMRHVELDRKAPVLEAVDDDPARMNSISDLVFITQFEIDLVDAGESEVDVRAHRKFVKKWGGSQWPA